MCAEILRERGKTMGRNREESTLRRSSIIHKIRTVLSFALLGAVLTGIVAGWADQPGGLDFRAVGAVAGAILAFATKAVYIV